MRVLIIGGTGMLGHKLVQSYRDKFDVWTTIRSKVDDYKRFQCFDKNKTFENVEVENLESVQTVIRHVKPSVIINAVGIVKQLPTAKDIVKTLTVNSIFPHHLSEFAQQYGARLINISTDCVFNGSKGNYTESDIPDALDLYGKSKNLGEVTTGNCLTLRTSIIGRELQNPHSLVEWFLSSRGKTVKGFTKAVFSGFPTIALAEIIADIIENQASLRGLYHVSSEPINKFDLLGLIKKAYRAEVEIEPFADFEIDRSLDSKKFREAAGFKPLQWHELIKKMADDSALYPYKDRII